MTNDLLIYDGRRDEWFRVVAYRSANQGERYVAATQPFEVLTAKQKRWASASYVVEPCPPPPPSKEWLDLRDAAEVMVSAQVAADPMSCPNSGNENAALEKITEALAALPSTEPEERFYVERRGEMFYVMDHDDDTASWLGDFIGKFNTEQDAEAFAAMKNQEADND